MYTNTTTSSLVSSSNSKEIAKIQRLIEKYACANAKKDITMRNFWYDYEAIGKSLAAATVFTGGFLLPVWMLQMVLGGCYGGLKELYLSSKADSQYNKIPKLEAQIKKLQAK